MNAVEIFLLSIALIVITTVRHGSAEGLCVDILSGVFRLGDQNTLTNFRMAYKKLSKTTIDKMLKPIEGDSPETIDTKKRYNDVIFGYMMDLYSGIQYVPIHLEHPAQWCPRKVSEDFGLEYDIRSNDCAFQVKMCEEFTTNYLLRYVPEINIIGVFYTLYKQWTEDIILDQISSYQNINTNLTLNTDYTAAYYLEHYTLSYFRYYETYVNDIGHLQNNKFNSVQTYCKKKGYKLLPIK